MDFTARPLRVLVVDDSRADIVLMSEAFGVAGSATEILTASGGEDALRMLRRTDTAKPDMVILDINMPLMDGRQTLVKIKETPELKKIPVVMFTTSNSHMDKDFATKWGADFITKPLRYAEVEGLAEEFVRRCDIEMDERA